MRDDARKAAIEGLSFGLVAGMIFALVEIAVAGRGGAPLLPLRMAASVLLGRAALETTPTEMAALVGMGVHLALSGLFGLAYGLLDGRRPQEPERSYSRQAGFGMLYGIALWLIDFQIVGRFSHPWFLAVPQLGQAVMHACFFGLPLALMFVQRARHSRALELPQAA